MTIASSILAVSLLMSNFAFANDQQSFDGFSPAGDEQVLTTDDDVDSDLSFEEERVAPAAIIAIIIAAAAFGCDRAKDEGKALARRDSSARRTYNNNRWRIRAGVAAASPAALVFLRCFENGLNGN